MTAAEQAAQHAREAWKNPTSAGRRQALDALVELVAGLERDLEYQRSIAVQAVELDAVCRALDARVRELTEALAMYHRWLERVDQVSRTGGSYMGLDHAVGENVVGCDGCAALAAAGEPGEELS